MVCLRVGVCVCVCVTVGRRERVAYTDMGTEIFRFTKFPCLWGRVKFLPLGTTVLVMSCFYYNTLSRALQA